MQAKIVSIAKIQNIFFYVVFANIMPFLCNRQVPRNLVNCNSCHQKVDIACLTSFILDFSSIYIRLVAEGRITLHIPLQHTHAGHRPFLNKEVLAYYTTLPRRVGTFIPRIPSLYSNVVTQFSPLVAFYDTHNLNRGTPNDYEIQIETYKTLQIVREY